MGKRRNVNKKRVCNNPDGRVRRATASEKVSKQNQRVRVKKELDEAMLDTDVPRLEAAIRVSASSSHRYGVRVALLVLAELRSRTMNDDSDDTG